MAYFIYKKRKYNRQVALFIQIWYKKEKLFQKSKYTFDENKNKWTLHNENSTTMSIKMKLVDEHSSSEDLPYKFNGKQVDEKTGLYYYGAR